MVDRAWSWRWILQLRRGFLQYDILLHRKAEGKHRYWAYRHKGEVNQHLAAVTKTELPQAPHIQQVHQALIRNCLAAIKGHSGQMME